jgi:hypothetical protein
VPIPDRIICTGRPVDRDGNAVGKPCGRRWHDQCGGCIAPAERHRAQHLAGEIQSARSAGWRIGPANHRGVYAAMCPRCAAPDPALVALCNELTRGNPVDQPGLFELDMGTALTDLAVERGA